MYTKKLSKPNRWLQEIVARPVCSYIAVVQRGMQMAFLTHKTMTDEKEGLVNKNYIDLSGLNQLSSKVIC